jgi:hypothetical protein
MEVDVVLVGKNELDVAEGIACPRSLADAHLPALDSVESPRRESTADPAITADELEPLAVKVAWVAAQPRQGLAPGDRGRHVPVGAEFDEAHLGVEQRRTDSSLRCRQ